jgi:hypothetical protein
MIRHSRAGGNLATLQDLIIEIIPVGIAFLNESHFPRAVPFLDLFFALDRRTHVLARFEIDQVVNPILPGKAIREVMLVFVNSFYQFACYAYV